MPKKTKISPLSLVPLGVAVAMSVLPAVSSAKDGYRIEVGATERIDEHMVCRNVKNNNGSPAHVPTRSAHEWSVGASAFLGAPRDGMAVSPCVADNVVPFWDLVTKTRYGEAHPTTVEWLHEGGDNLWSDIQIYYLKNPNDTQFTAASYSLVHKKTSAGIWYNTAGTMEFKEYASTKYYLDTAANSSRPNANDATVAVQSYRDGRERSVFSLCTSNPKTQQSYTIPYSLLGPFNIAGIDAVWCGNTSWSMTASQIEGLSDETDAIFIRGRNTNTLTLPGAYNSNQVYTDYEYTGQTRDYRLYLFNNSSASVFVDTSINVATN